jgi:hypothetical protein
MMSQHAYTGADAHCDGVKEPLFRGTDRKGYGANTGGAQGIDAPILTRSVLIERQHFQDVSNMLQQDQHSTEHFKTKVDEYLKDAIAATRIMDGFQQPQANSAHLKAYQSFPFEFVVSILGVGRDTQISLGFS